jgi:O-antigen ligase
VTRIESEPRPRLLLLLIFVALSGLLLYNTCRMWDAIDTQEKWARAAELLLIAVGAWVVVWPESFPFRRSTKGASGDLTDADQHPQRS